MYRLLPLICVLLGLGTSACEKDACSQSWTQVVSVPVTLSRAAVQDSIAALPARQLCTGGNLYAFGNYVFVNENRVGYHLLDNTDPANPRNVAFLRVPGATHMAFVDGRMVSDSYADMVVLDFEGPNSLKLLSSTPNLLLRTDGFIVEDDEVAIGFEDREVTFTEDCTGFVSGQCNDCDVLFENLSATGQPRGANTGNVQVNTGGSLARLAFCSRTLYVLAPNRLTTFRLEGETLVNASETNLTQGQEAIVLEGRHLYVVSQWGLQIFEIGDCGLPIARGFAERFWSNDPVAIEGDRAVVALRTGNVPTPERDGRLMVYDISDRNNPRVMAQHPLAHPVGVALRDGKLYVCDGIDGLLVYDFDAQNPGRLRDAEIQRVADADVVDLALLPYAAGTVLLGVGHNTVSQYSVDAEGLLTPLSTLGAQRCTGS